MSKPEVVCVGVGVALFNNNGDLLLERRADNGLWGFVGGEIEFGETILECARREVKEETGFDISDVVELIGVYSWPAYTKVEYPERVVQKIAIFLKTAIISGVLTKSDESEELKFFDLARSVPLDSFLDIGSVHPMSALRARMHGVIK